jgi:hypothetical protein
VRLFLNNVNKARIVYYCVKKKKKRKNIRNELKRSIWRETVPKVGLDDKLYFLGD